MRQPRGNPEKISKEIIDKIKNGMRIGMEAPGAAVVSGITKRTFYNWIAKGKIDQKDFKLDKIKKKTLYIALVESVEIAAQECDMRDLMVIDKCANGIDLEFAVHPKGAKDRKTGESIEGQIVYNARGNPIIKRPAKTADWNAAAWRISRRNRRVWGSLSEGGSKDGMEGKKDTVVVHMPSNGYEAPGTKIALAAPAIESDAEFPETLSPEDDEEST
jgi:hypothetical protein